MVFAWQVAPSPPAAPGGCQRCRPEASAHNAGGKMIELDEQQQSARAWFESLRDRICAEFEAIEREASPSTGSGQAAAFDYIAWDRADPEAG